MRKGIKIKASLIILSWLVITAHNIIPHNHHENDFCILKGHSHTAAVLYDEYHSHCEDHDICRISGLLFHKFSQDNLIIENKKNDLLVPDLRTELIPDYNKHIQYRDSYYTSASLRAPPAS